MPGSPTAAAKYRRHERDVGSPEFQVAVLTARIKQISQHLNQAPKDRMGRRGLLQLVGKRRKLLDYLHRQNPQSYRSLIEKLKIRR